MVQGSLFDRDSFYNTLKEKMNEILGKKGENFDWFTLPDYGIFSALGGRTCYSKDSPVKVLFEDKRVYDPEERISYLKRIANKHHYSIFAHTPVISELSDIPSPLFKSYTISVKVEGKQRYFNLYNLRHIIEVYGKECLDKLLVKDSVLSEEFLKGFFFAYKRKDGGVEILTAFQAYEEGFDKKVKEYILFNYIPFSNYGWIVAVAHGYSRVFSHQLVRHTLFNFSQRSFRFTQTFGIYLPETLRDLFDDPNFECNQKFDQCYYELLEMGYKREDARYLYPMGARTTIMFSGPVFVFEDFIQKRLDKAAQAEIREVAFILRNLIDVVVKPWGLF